ncbi:MAG TPA: hypothetical protein PLD49_10240 [Thermoclostridium caenicola]|uniref:hypothetical protein n=1 Tax=Thermoclostridium caenicola TaxID=659425 RepID=UPI002C0DF7A3|nr:hypothetical protein [Thermoclostridium caenicola]HOK44026.1 hypothetical protein [Thermoclostridium caenicola]HOL85483.1 hypothetical protein [Thermoclostridium caenicola]HPO77003.1 hypothetical protein [Thermoclostridium caenicola]HPU21365.1 hypothetical protein [Thermoclostridium caenicola]
MKLTIFNGSPRGENSNTSIIIKWLEEGILSREGCSLEIFRLNRTEEHDNYAARFGASDGIILVFPNRLTHGISSAIWNGCAANSRPNMPEPA